MCFLLLTVFFIRLFWYKGGKLLYKIFLVSNVTILTFSSIMDRYLLGSLRIFPTLCDILLPKKAIFSWIAVYQGPVSRPLREIRSEYPQELIYADELALISKTLQSLKGRLEVVIFL